MADHFSIYRALDDVAPRGGELRHGWTSELKTLRGPGAKACGAPHLELAANELPHVPAIGVMNVDAEAHLAVGEAPRHVDADRDRERHRRPARELSLIHISEPTRLGMISYAVFCLKKKKKK